MTVEWQDESDSFFFPNAKRTGILSRARPNDTGQEQCDYR